MSATRDRDRAFQAAKTDFAGALQRARGISEPWFRAQALAAVARFAPDADVDRIAMEALKAAGDDEDAYRQVGASAWAICALVERGRKCEAAGAAEQLLEVSPDISHPVSRVCALMLLWQALSSLDHAVRQQVLNQMVKTGQSAMSWRIGSTLRDVVLMLGNAEPAEARRVLEQMPENRYKRQAQRRLEEGQLLEPRQFFW